MHVEGPQRASRVNSATSQFFVVNNKNGSRSLDGQYAAFGHIIAGTDVLDAIS
jgi:cyclophilin family peptidyl-prolyl cis-trans isomerase